MGNQRPREISAHNNMWLRPLHSDQYVNGMDKGSMVQDSIRYRNLLNQVMWSIQNSPIQLPR